MILPTTGRIPEYTQGTSTGNATRLLNVDLLKLQSEVFSPIYLFSPCIIFQCIDIKQRAGNSVLLILL